MPATHCTAGEGGKGSSMQATRYGRPDDQQQRAHPDENEGLP